MFKVALVACVNPMSFISALLHCFLTPEQHVDTYAYVVKPVKPYMYCLGCLCC